MSWGSSSVKIRLMLALTRTQTLETTFWPSLQAEINGSVLASILSTGEWIGTKFSCWQVETGDWIGLKNFVMLVDVLKCKCFGQLKMMECQGVDLFPAPGSPILHSSREHMSPNFVSISINTNPTYVCGSPIREFSSPGQRARKLKLAECISD